MKRTRNGRTLVMHGRCHGGVFGSRQHAGVTDGGTVNHFSSVSVHKFLPKKELTKARSRMTASDFTTLARSSVSVTSASIDANKIFPLWAARAAAQAVGVASPSRLRERLERTGFAISTAFGGFVTGFLIPPTSEATGSAAWETGASE